MDDYIALSAQLWAGMVSLFTEYNVVSQLVPFVRHLLGSTNCLRLFVDSMLFSCERAEIECIMGMSTDTFTWTDTHARTHARIHTSTYIVPSRALDFMGRQRVFHA